ncbi:phosphodiester glycosidase family protein [Candidatus Margulisiibacteriota bacterium]
MSLQVTTQISRPVKFNPQVTGPGIRQVQRITVKGKRRAAGFAVWVDPAKIRLFYDKEMLSYDFSTQSVVKPPLAGTSFESAKGKLLKDIVGDEIVFACSGQTGNMWSSNSIMVVDGKIIKRNAPGVATEAFIPLDGTYTFFVFDPANPRLGTLSFERGELKGSLNFRNAVSGPVLIEAGKDVSTLIRQAEPNTQSNEVLWDPATFQAAMSAVGCTRNGQIILVSLAGNPDLQNEIRLKDMVAVLKKLKAHNAILLGESGEVQQFVLTDKRQSLWVTARARSDSSMVNMFPDGRPRSSAILVER